MIHRIRQEHLRSTYKLVASGLISLDKGNVATIGSAVQQGTLGSCEDTQHTVLVERVELKTVEFQKKFHFK
jgi:hypothetical protein